MTTYRDKEIANTMISRTDTFGNYLVELSEKISKLTEDELIERDLYLRDIAVGLRFGPATGYPSIDKSFLKYYSKEDICTKIPRESAYELLKITCRDNPKGIALTYVPQKNVRCNISFRRMMAEIDKIAVAFRSHAKEEDEIVACVLPNFPEAKEMVFAAIKSGIALFPINPLTPPNVLKEMLINKKISTVIIWAGFISKYEDAILASEDSLDYIVHLNGDESLSPFVRAVAKIKASPKRGMISSSKSITYKEYISLKNKRCILDEYEYDENKTVLIEGTSGTTGIPKGVCLSGRNICASIIQQIHEAIDFKHEKNFYDIMNASLAYGAIEAIIATVAGLRTFFEPGFTMDPYQFVIDNEIDVLFGGPVHCNNLNKHIERGDQRPKINEWITGGAPLNKSVEYSINGIDENYNEDINIKPDVIVRQGYGATENAGAVTYQKKGSYKPGSIGIPFTKENLAIFDPTTGEEKMINEVGEVAVYGELVMKGYLNNEAETAKVLRKHSDGTTWLHLGDIGSIDDEGRLYFVDRIKNMFGRNGINVHPNKIAEFIGSLEYIDSCVVAGVEHPFEQMVPVAFVKLKENVKSEDILEQIATDCFMNLEESSIPYEFIYVEDIPKNAGGKPDVIKLKADYKIDYSNAVENKMSLEKINV